ncbi:MAG TPA: Crp/Fnr family transcriptional regulator [Sphingomicrobium sp.]|nr:Crp/Fnr family transcriptional regulator [Sphingomicrobium sp.]
MPNNPLELLLDNLELRSPLAKDDREAVLALPYTLKSLAPGSYAVREGEPPSGCGVLVTGFAYRQKLTGDGGRQILSIHVPGEALDFQNIFLNVADHSVQMLTRGHLAVIPRADIQKIVRSSAAIGHAILLTILVEASIFREWILNVGRRDAKSRLAHILCELAVRLDALGLAEDMGYHLPMTQAELADALGLTPVHLNRVIRSLETDGLINRSKREISFPDWERMRDMADFNDRYLHLAVQESAALAAAR